MDITKSIHFIEENGSDIEKVRLRHILYDAIPNPEILHPFLELQNGDGGFPHSKIKGYPSTTIDTLNALWWMEELGMLHSSSSEKAFIYLIDAQLEDGGWDENPPLSQENLPPWIVPGSLHTRHYLSAYSAFWLAIKGFHSFPAFRMALDYLDTHFLEKTLFKGFLHTTWIASSLFLMAGEPYIEAAMSGLQILIRKPKSEWEDSQLAWALDCLGKAGLPRKHPFVQMGIKELIRRQAPDGSWSSEDGQVFVVNGTIAALKAFKHYHPI
ncbi:MAG: hypothetical protein A2Z14_04690 [Chloroflexi bacterium RBG_16_48_8]|nr:MAG: hypothetical protein A2Z14_04690 [Chloroflexi bacterium RBG_16_48_8]